LVQHLDDVQGLIDAQVIGLLRDPGRMLVDVGEGGDKGVAVHAGRLDSLEAAHFALSCLKGWVACQWRAISTRRANHTCSRPCPYSMNWCSDAKRARRPSQAQVMPMVNNLRDS